MEKSDKKSIIIASIFLVILLGCLMFMIYIKFFMNNSLDKNQNNNVIEPSVLNIDDIIDELNNSSTVNTYRNNNVIIEITKNNTGFNIKFTNNDKITNFEGVYTKNILGLKFNNDEETVIIGNLIFSELVNISCKKQGYNEGDCNKTVSSFLEGNYEVDGLGKSEIGNNQLLLSVDTSKKIELMQETDDNIQNQLKNIEDTDYQIELGDLKLINPLSNYDEVNNEYKYTATITGNNLTDNGELNVDIKIYDVDKKVLKVTNEELTITNDPDGKGKNLEYVIKFEKENFKFEDLKYISIDFKMNEKE